MSFFTTIVNDFTVTEQWVVTQINAAWAEEQKVQSWVDSEVTSISTWLNSHQTALLALFTEAAVLVPSAAPEIAAAQLALDAATAAADTLSKNLIAGTTPVSVISSAYTAAK